MAIAAAVALFVVAMIASSGSADEGVERGVGDIGHGGDRRTSPRRPGGIRPTTPAILER